ncbi:MAG: L-2-amino-thiazoline-4-carboxylic acid hydrolase [Anaerolineales bacterium]|nr:L-2-amino-thiazoline-4-carboxylic acid hydrolase [Anaerolineales bacterium]
MLRRREIEARILIPLIEALSAEFGHERVLENVQRTILGIARSQGAALAEQMNGRGLKEFHDRFPLKKVHLNRKDAKNAKANRSKAFAPFAAWR